MNITSLEIAQATMDMFFCLFCLIMFRSVYKELHADRETGC